MGLNKSKGNMYEWVTHTWSPIIGCIHQCKYCYVKAYRDLPVKPFIKENDFPPLGKERIIFVGHTCDMFGDNTPIEWVKKVYNHCIMYPDNKYVFQTKNTLKLINDFKALPDNFIIGTTIETNRADLLAQFSKAPKPEDRAKGLSQIKVETFVTIEPIMKFDVDSFIELLKLAKPSWVNIGADSKRHNLPEPTIKEIQALVVELEIAGIPIRKKMNLQRLERHGI
jgi:DNA repair photolyase